MQGWRDRLIYAAVWLACLAPILQMVWLGFQGDLTANPIEFVLRALGDWGLRLLLVSLAITPAAKLLRQPRLIRYRRTIGLWAFTYIVLHLSMYIGVDQFFDWKAIGKDILKRPYITIGMTAFVLLIPLAVTSTNGMLRRMGPKAWRRLHRLVYLIAPLGVIHYYLLVKADVREPLLYGAILAALLAYRVYAWNTAKRAQAAKASAKATAAAR
jgi:methionine sulfoxide reductase heme-binding subunit